MLVFEDIHISSIYVHNQANCHCRHLEVQTGSVWRLILSISYVSVISLSFLLVMLFQNSLHTVFPSVTPPVVSLPTTFSHGMGQLALSYMWQLPPCFYNLMMHMLGTNPPRPPSPVYNMHIRHLCNPSSESPGYGRA